MLSLPSRNLSQQLSISIPVVKSVIERISHIDGYTATANYEEGSLPFISPKSNHEVNISVKNVATIGQGERRLVYVLDGYGNKVPIDSVSNLKEITITVRVNFDELTDELNSWSIMNNIKDRLRWDSVLTELEKVNIGVMRYSDARNTSFSFRGRTINAYEMDIILSTTTNDPEYDPGATWIETVDATGKLFKPLSDTITDITNYETTDVQYIFDEDSRPESFNLLNTGDKAWMMGTDQNMIFEYVLTDALNIETIQYTNKSLNVSDNSKCFRWINNGEKLLTISSFPINTIFEYSSIIPYDLGTLSLDGYYSLEDDIQVNTGIAPGSSSINSRGFDFDQENNVISVVNIQGQILQYKYYGDIEQIQYVDIIDLKPFTSLFTNFQEIRFINNSKFILCAVSTGKEYSLWDVELDNGIITDVSTRDNFFSIPGISSRGFDFNDLSLFVLDRTSKKLIKANYADYYKVNV